MNVNLEFDLELNNSSCLQPVQALSICNKGDTLERGTLEIRSTSDALVPFETPLPVLESGTVTPIPQACLLQTNLPYLNSLCHPLVTEMVLTVYCDGVPVYSWAQQFRVDKPLTEEVEYT